jgi:hypothetical protein
MKHLTQLLPLVLAGCGSAFFMHAWDKRHLKSMIVWSINSSGLGCTGTPPLHGICVNGEVYQPTKDFDSFNERVAERDGWEAAYSSLLQSAIDSRFKRDAEKKAMAAFSAEIEKPEKVQP